MYRYANKFNNLNLVRYPDMRVTGWRGQVCVRPNFSETQLKSAAEAQKTKFSSEASLPTLIPDFREKAFLLTTKGMIFDILKIIIII